MLTRLNYEQCFFKGMSHHLQHSTICEQLPFPDPYFNDCQKNAQSHHIKKMSQLFGFVPPEILLSHIVVHLDLADICSVSMVNRATFSLLFIRDATTLQIAPKPKSYIPLDLTLQKQIYSIEETSEMVQQLVWKRLVLQFYPRFNKNANVKNWLHVLRRRIVLRPPKQIRKEHLPPNVTKKQNEFFVENCEWIYECPLHYESLKQVVGEGDVKRYCEVCKEHVYKASSEIEWTKYVGKGYCVSFVEGPKRIRKMGRVKQR